MSSGPSAYNHRVQIKTSIIINRSKHTNQEKMDPYILNLEVYMRNKLAIKLECRQLSKETVLKVF